MFRERDQDRYLKSQSNLVYPSKHDVRLGFANAVGLVPLLSLLLHTLHYLLCGCNYINSFVFPI